MTGVLLPCTDQITCFLSDHDSRRARIARGDGRHHRGIGNAEPLDAVNAEIWPDNGHAILSHLARPHGVPDGFARLPDELFQRRRASNLWSGCQPHPDL